MTCDLKIALIALLVVVSFCLALGFIHNRTNVCTYDGVVSSAYVKRQGSADRFYVVLRTQSGELLTFTVQDTVWWWRWRSADEYARLAPGKRVWVKTAGYRIGILSWFPNVVDMEVVE